VSRRSVSFDRAAEYYDETRGLTPDGVAMQTLVLAEELRGRGRVLEIGIGTGQVALPLHDAGIPLIGLDLSSAMLARLVRKAVGGHPPFPLVLGDATRLPIRDGGVGAVVLRWVLHLIPEWRTALAEIARVVEPGGVVLVLLGSYDGDEREEVQERFADVTGLSRAPAGLMWGATDELDEAIADVGGILRPLPSFRVSATQTLAEFVDALEANKYSWTWPVPDDLRRRAAAEVRTWAVERFGPLEQVGRGRDAEVAWRAYDFGADRGPVPLS
jgi:SAM-dependent methyltransferase